MRDLKIKIIHLCVNRMTSTPQDLSKLPLQESSSETIGTIFKLLRQLFDIYTNELPELLPNELLQVSHIFSIFSEVCNKMTQSQTRFLSIQKDFAEDLSKALLNFNLRITTFRDHHDIFKNFADQRFTNKIWEDNPYFELLKHIYYLIKKYSVKILYAIDNLDRRSRQQMHFYLANFLNYFSPTNYAWSNPEVIQTIIESNGHNLLHGIKNYLEDLVLNNGKLNIRMTDLKSFAVGKNLAITAGKVIFQNELIQLIQYQSQTNDVYKTPILFIPPWINKYYILDLSPANSMVNWLVQQGFTVFMISWVNPNEKLSHKTFDNYMLEGPMQALDIISKQLNITSVHMVGYCIGGTLLACTLAYMQAKKDLRCKSASFFMSLLNFSNPGEIGVFLDQPQIDALELMMKKRGYLNGRLLDITFNILRPNELIWPYFINNYLLGKTSKPFDILYWNADSSNLPYQMYNFYLRNMYLHNKLRHGGAIILDGTPIDLNTIVSPTFFVGSETDHITLWRAIFSGLRLLNGPLEFILSESGHVRAVVNPPTTQNKYGFKSNTNFSHAKAFKVKSKEWLETAQQHTGSWWPYWRDWLLSHDQQKIPACERQLNNGIETAPGSYVKKRI